MVASAEMKCVVCEKSPAVLYCHQDDAHLCHACDQQVHSANPLASRHQRVAISCKHDIKDEDQVVPEAISAFDAQPSAATEPVQKTDGAELAFDDDAFFAVPDIDMPGFGAEDNAAKVILGKSFASDEFDFGEIDPSWLDRLDVGLDRLPSDILDSLVPEAPPAPKPAAKQAEPPVRPLSPPAHELAHPPMQHHHHAQPAPLPHPAAMQPYAHPALVPQFAPPAEPATWESAAPAESAIDIDSYIPRSLLPVDASTRVQLLRARREKLERFREKKRNRHFKKTIRYASRKAYAEVRPRIKGRFARKDEVAAMRAAGLLPAVA